MGFKEILETWEQSKASNKQMHTARNMQEAWLERHAVPDKDSAEDCSVHGISKSISKKELQSIPVDGSLDLHGYTVKEAELLLEDFFERAARNGWRKVCIIHGKGNHSKAGAVLAKFVKDWLETCPYAGRTMQAQAHHGGSGAVIVFIKTTR